MKNKLQVLINNEWEYVFCKTQGKNLPIITKDKQKAIPGDQHALSYFQNSFGNLNFRIAK